MSPSWETVHNLSGKDETLVFSFTSRQRLKVTQGACCSPSPATASLKYDSYSVHLFFFFKSQDSKPNEARRTCTEIASQNSQGLSRHTWGTSGSARTGLFEPISFSFLSGLLPAPPNGTVVIIAAPYTQTRTSWRSLIVPRLTNPETEQYSHKDQ